MEVVSALHMIGGVGENSYARNSYMQKTTLCIANPVKEEAISKLYQTMSKTTNNITIADFGCSSATDSIWYVFYTLIKAINGVHSTLGEKHSPPNFTIYLNDLYGTDFNTIFKSISPFLKTIKKNNDYFIYGAPGSFHGRLFPTQSLHFVHSSYAIHWLSQIPKGIENNNNQNIYISATSPASVSKAYITQFKNDLMAFLTCRSEEMIDEGWMVLTLAGRRSEDPSTIECCYVWDLLAIALNQMVSEGLIQQEQMKHFNIPIYYPSPKEIEDTVKEEGSFTIHRFEVTEVDWDSTAYIHNNYQDKENGNMEHTNGFHHNSNNNNRGLDHTHTVGEERYVDFAACIRAVIGPILTAHFGEAIIEDVFRRYKYIVADHMTKRRGSFINLTISLCKNARSIE